MDTEPIRRDIQFHVDELGVQLALLAQGMAQAIMDYRLWDTVQRERKMKDATREYSKCARVIDALRVALNALATIEVEYKPVPVNAAILEMEL